MTATEIAMEAIGWFSTLTFLYSIVIPRRVRLHEWGMVTSIATGMYSFYHGATAIWVKWIIAFFFHLYMRRQLRKNESEKVMEKL